MKLKREAKTLKAKAIASLKRGLEAFNNHDDEKGDVISAWNISVAFRSCVKIGDNLFH